jgi:hypothetical protein
MAVILAPLHAIRVRFALISRDRIASKAPGKPRQRNHWCSAEVKSAKAIANGNPAFHRRGNRFGRQNRTSGSGKMLGAPLRTKLRTRMYLKSLYNTLCCETKDFPVVITDLLRLEVRTRLPPWRRSADRACLQANSLKIVNFSGNLPPSGDFGGMKSLNTLHPRQIFWNSVGPRKANSNQSVRTN